MVEFRREVKQLAQFVEKHGWVGGLRRWTWQDSGQACRWITNEMSSGQIAWALLLPPPGGKDIFIADVTFGAAPIVLSKIYNRVLSWSFLPDMNKIAEERARHLGVENVVFLNDVVSDSLLNFKCEIELSIFILSSDLLNVMPRATLKEGLKSVLREIAGRATQGWTNIILSPKKVRMERKALWESRGFSQRELVSLSKEFNFVCTRTYFFRRAPEDVREVLPSRNWSRKGLKEIGGYFLENCLSKKLVSNSLKHAIKSSILGFPSRVLVLSRFRNQRSIMDGLLENIQSSKLVEGPLTVQRYFRGNPNTILLRLGGPFGKKYICRIPLGFGSSIARASTNYAMLEKLRGTVLISKKVPKPVTKGEYQNQLYFLETYLEGCMCVMTSANCQELYGKVRPYLFSFVLDNGREHKIEEETFTQIIGKDIRTLKKYGKEGKDEDRINILESVLKERFMGRTMRLGLMHGDFKIENILFDSEGVSGVFDWDLGTVMGLPFVDLLYFYWYSFYYEKSKGIIDFIMNCFSSGGGDPCFKAWCDEYREALAISQDAVVYYAACFWIHYITNVGGALMSNYNKEQYQINIKQPLEFFLRKVGA